MINDKWKQTFANRLRLAIETSGMNKKEVALLANISPASISQYLNGAQIPSSVTMMKLTKVLKVDIEYFMNF